MSVGRGVGVPWGGGALSADDPITYPGEEPYTFDFTDEPDGPLPGEWGSFRYDVVAGVITSSLEVSPDTYYKVENGFGFWAYERTPTTGDPYSERGIVANPLGIVSGRNPRLSILFRSPLDLLDGSNDEFVFELFGGVRSDADAQMFVGGQVRAHWVAGSGWTTPIVVEAIQSLGVLPVSVIATATLPETNEDTDLWKTASTHELEVLVLEDVLRVSMDGNEVEVPITINDNTHPLVGVRIYHLNSGVITPVPAIVGIQLSMCRSAVKDVGPAPAILGNISLETGSPPLLTLPLRDMVEKGVVKRVGAYAFEFVDDLTADVGGKITVWNAGSRVRVIDKYVGQEFSRVIVDLAYERSKRVPS